MCYSSRSFVRRLNRLHHDRIKDPEVGSPYASYVDAVDNVEVTGKYTGLIHLETPYAGLESYGLQMIPITPIEEWDNLKTNPVGTGPFVFKEWVMGEKIVFEKNPNYWKEGLPYLDELVFQFFPQYQTLLQSLRAGDTDAVHWIDNADVDPLKREGELDVFGMTFPGFFYLGFNVNTPPFDNKLVRQAAMYAVDKDAVLEAAQFGYGDTGDINIDKSDFFFMDDFEYERDLDKAKELLAEAGFPEGVEGELIAPDTPTERPIAESVAWSLSQAGINLTPRILKVPEFINIVFTNHEAGAFICGYAAPRDPDYFNWSYLYSEGSYNLWDYVNPEMDEYLEITHTDTDPAVRKDAYREVYSILMEDAPVVFLITVDGAILAMEHPAAAGGDFNIVGPSTTAYDEGAKKLAKALDIPVHIVQMPMGWYFEVSTAKARQVLGFKPEWTYDRMIESALAYRRGEDIGVLPALL